MIKLRKLKCCSIKVQLSIAKAFDSVPQKRLLISLLKKYFPSFRNFSKYSLAKKSFTSYSSIKNQITGGVLLPTSSCYRCYLPLMKTVLPPFFFAVILPNFDWKQNRRILFLWQTMSEFIVFKRMGQPRPLFSLFSVLSSKQYNFYNKSMWKNVVHPVYGAGIQTRNLSNMSCHP